LEYCVPNYQNQPSFVQDMINHFGLFFSETRCIVLAFQCEGRYFQIFYSY